MEYSYFSSPYPKAAKVEMTGTNQSYLAQKK
jgi:hypothetical protein